MPARRPIEERFWEKVDKNGPTMPHMQTNCWVWTASTSGGYGNLGDGNGGLVKATHVSWMIHHVLAPVKPLLHHCDNPPCVRPDHLYSGTQKENARDREVRGRGNHPHGDDHPSRRDPSYLKRGDDHHMRRDEFRPRGEKNVRAKLTEELVRLIRKERRETGAEYEEIALKYDVDKTTVGRICRRDTWSHLED
jgi:hypothetical protein